MASTYITRTPSSTTNQKTWTVSCWVKRSLLTSTQMIWGVNGDSSGNYFTELNFNSGDQLEFRQGGTVGDPYQTQMLTNARYRDTNGWYHIVVAADTTQSTEANRLKIYINGEQITSWAIANYPSQNETFRWNYTGYAHSIGRSGQDNARYFDGYISHFHSTDGNQYAASDFGETDSTTGIWKIKTSPSVTYGTNGFFVLKDGNNLSGSTVQDQSGQGNNFTASGNLTSLKDCPDNVFTTWSPLHHSTQSISNVVFKYGNTGFDNNESSSSVYPQVYSTLAASSGKYYLESKLIATNGNTASYIGISGAVTTEAYIAQNAYTYAYRENGTVRNNDVNGNTYTSYGVNDIIQIAVDLDNNKLYFGINGTWVNSGDPTSGATGTGAVYTITAPSSTPHGVYHFTIGDTSSPGTFEHATNFGNGYFGTTAVTSAQSPDDGIGIFEYDVPAGYRALCTKSINAEEYS